MINTMKDAIHVWSFGKEMKDSDIKKHMMLLTLGLGQRLQTNEEFPIDNSRYKPQLIRNSFIGSIL